MRLCNSTKQKALLVLGVVLVLMSAGLYAAGNNALVNETGSFNNALVEQSAAGNQADVNQNSMAISVTETNNVNVFQSSAGNTAVVNQGSVENGTFARSVSATVSQNGTGNNRAEINQGTDVNILNSQALIEQSIGSGNQAVIDQCSGSAPLNFDIAAVYQHGSINKAEISQSWSGNTAKLYQNGDLNIGDIIQEAGSGNVVNLTQSEGSVVTIRQSGAGNIVKGIGADELASSLNGSRLQLLQTGSGNILELSQANGASASVTQNGMTNKVVIIQN